MIARFRRFLSSGAPRGSWRRTLGRLLIIAFLAAALPILIVWLVVAQPVFFPSPNTHGTIAVEPARLEFHVRVLSEKLVPRGYGHAEKLDEAADYIRTSFASATSDATEQPFSVGGATYRNVITLLGPDTKKRIVVGAHYDAADGFPGADDNASGVAGLIELSRTLAKADLGMRVELVAFTLEEPPAFATPVMGSAIHARSLRDAAVDVRMMISLEMIGYFTDAPGSQRYPVHILRFIYPTRGNFLAVVGRTDQRRAILAVKKPMLTATRLPIRSIAAPTALPGIDFSDHRSYWAEGYAAVMITDTAFYRNTAYHTAEDTADRLDYQRMALGVEAVGAAIIALSHESP